jgi:hypothetical protein
MSVLRRFLGWRGTLLDGRSALDGPEHPVRSGRVPRTVLTGHCGEQRAVNEYRSWRWVVKARADRMSGGRARLRILGCAGRFFSVPACVTLPHCRPLCRGVHGQIADGRPGRQRGRCTPSASTDSHGVPRPAAGSGLTRAAESSVHPGVPAQWPGGDYRELRGPPDATSRWPREIRSWRSSHAGCSMSVPGRRPAPLIRRRRSRGKIAPARFPAPPGGDHGPAARFDHPRYLCKQGGLVRCESAGGCLLSRTRPATDDHLQQIAQRTDPRSGLRLCRSTSSR